jgi:hypothetical protein
MVSIAYLADLIARLNRTIEGLEERIVTAERAGDLAAAGLARRSLARAYLDLSQALDAWLAAEEE